jgi:hypothetical protein
MTDDRELLELAAKAAGRGSQWWMESTWNGPDKEWNPLTDDGDALRLAVKLGLIVECGRAWISRHGPMFGEDVLPDPYAATRRAIVRAAAAIGEKT